MECYRDTIYRFVVWSQLIQHNTTRKLNRILNSTRHTELNKPCPITRLTMEMPEMSLKTRLNTEMNQTCRTPTRLNNGQNSNLQSHQTAEKKCKCQIKISPMWTIVQHHWTCQRNSPKSYMIWYQQEKNKCQNSYQLHLWHGFIKYPSQSNHN